MAKRLKKNWTSFRRKVRASISLLRPSKRRCRITGTVATVREQDNTLAFTAADFSKALAKPLATGTFAGTGGIEGDEVATGRVKRRSFGRVFNVEGRLLLAAYNIYEFGDPARPLQGCAALRDKGRSGDLVILAWQGSITATLDALKAAVVPTGGGVFAPSIACAKWWTEPAGPLTADLLGEIGSGYGETVASIAAAISADLAGPAVSNVATTDALRSAAAGWHVQDANTTGAKVLDDMLAGAGLFWVLSPAGSIEIVEWSWDGVAEAVTGIYVGREEQFAPHQSRKLGFHVNQRKHDDGEIAADILLSDIVSDTGEPLSDLIDALTATVDAKRTIFVQPTAPTAAESEENDWWQQTTADRATVLATYRRVAGSGRLAIGDSAITLGDSYVELCWTPVEDQRIIGALDAATSAANLADSKAVVFTMYSASDPVPTGTDIGDILVRAYMSPVQVDYWSGTSWAAAATYGATADQLATLTAALTAAGNAQATADGKIDTFYQTTAPAGASLGDLWFDTDDGNKLYRHNGTSWVAVQDAAIGAAITAAAGAQATADGKVVTFVGESAPTAEGAGDLWYKASTKTMSRWSGSAWVSVSSLGAPTGTNVGSTPADTVESGANAGGAAANPDGTIKTDKVTTGALTTSAALDISHVDGGSTSIVGTSWTTVVSVSRTPYDGNSKFIILFSGIAELDADNPSSVSMGISLEQNGTSIWSASVAKSDSGRPKPFSGMVTVAPGAGLKTYTLKANRTSSANTAGTIVKPTIVILEAKKNL